MNIDYHQVVATFNSEFKPTGYTCDLTSPITRTDCQECPFYSTIRHNPCGVDIDHKHAALPSFLDFLAEHYPEHLI